MVKRREEDDYFFKKGIEQGIEQAMLRLLKAGVLSTGQLASLFEVSEALVEQLRRRLADQ